MTAQTIQDIHKLPEAMPVLDLTATVTHIAERKSGTSKYGSWSIQFVTLEDDTGKISVMAKDRPEDFAEFDWIGKRVIIAAHKSDKHGWQGALAHDNDYKAKQNPERVIKLTKTGRIELAAGELPDPTASEPPSSNGKPHQNGGAEEPAIAATLRERDPHASARPSALSAPASEPDADAVPSAPPATLSLAEFLVLASHVHDRCAKLTSSAESATLTSTVLEQVARGHVRLTEDDHLAILLVLHGSSVAQFCEFINLKKGEHHTDLETLSTKIKREAVRRFQDDPLDLIEQMDRTVSDTPATNGGAAHP